jgi:putative CocE/NonD family hydrolase
MSEDGGLLYDDMTDQALYVTMRDGVKIAVDLILPKGLGPKNKIPALLDITRYWRLQRGAVPNADTRFFVSHGYAVLLVDERGTGASFGVWKSPFARDAVKDDGGLVDWIVAQPWSNGKVGAIGTSYEGGTAQLVPVTGSTAVRAVIPRFEEFDNYTDIGFPGGIFGKWQVKEWSDAVKQLDNNLGVKPVDDDADSKLVKQAMRERGSNLDVYSTVSKIVYRDDKPGSLGETIDDFSLFASQSAIEQSRAAIYGWGSWLDAVTADGVIRRFSTFSNPQRVIIGAWNHGGFQNADPYSSPATPFYPQHDECLRYFDHYLKGVENGVGSENEIIFYTMGQERWKSTRVWPPTGSTTHRWYMAPGGELSLSAPNSGQASDTYKVDLSATTGTQNRWHTEVGGSAVVYPDRSAEDKRLLTYTSPPLVDDVEITGAPVIDLYVTSTESDGAFFVYLEDVDQNGRVTYLTEGELRAIHRKISSEPPPYKMLTPYHSFKRADSQPLTPGQVAELKFGLISTSVLIRQGHRIRVAIAGADKDTFARVPEEGTPVISVLRDKQHLSFIELPVIPNEYRDRQIVDPWAALRLARLPETGPERPTPSGAGPLPSATEILDRYIAAVGGRESIDRLRTEVSTGIRVSGDGVPEETEHFWEFPGKILGIRRGAGLWVNGSNGLIKWTLNPYERLTEIKDPEPPAGDKNWGPQAPLHLKEQYSDFKVSGRQFVCYRETFVVDAVDARHSPVKMYFDSETGLLVRRDGKQRIQSLNIGADGVVHRRFSYADGSLYFGDYRDVEGVKQPFLVNSTLFIGPQRNPVLVTERIYDIKHNVPIDSARFEMPRK